MVIQRFLKKKWPARQKFKIVMEGLKGKPVIDICNDYGISQSMYYRWKDQFLDNGHDVFEMDKRTTKETRLIRENSKLKQCLAESTLELKKMEEDW